MPSSNPAFSRASAAPATASRTPAGAHSPSSTARPASTAPRPARPVRRAVAVRGDDDALHDDGRRRHQDGPHLPRHRPDRRGRPGWALPGHGGLGPRAPGGHRRPRPRPGDLVQADRQPGRHPGLRAPSRVSLVGAISEAFNAEYFGGSIVTQAVIGTFGVFAGMLVVYKTGAIRVTPKLTRWIVGALIGVLVARAGQPDRQLLHRRRPGPA